MDRDTNPDAALPPQCNPRLHGKGTPRSDCSASQVLWQPSTVLNDMSSSGNEESLDRYESASAIRGTNNPFSGHRSRAARPFDNDTPLQRSVSHSGIQSVVDDLTFPPWDNLHYIAGSRQSDQSEVRSKVDAGPYLQSPLNYLEINNGRWTAPPAKGDSPSPYGLDSRSLSSRVKKETAGGRHSLYAELLGGTRVRSSSLRQDTMEGMNNQDDSISSNKKIIPSPSHAISEHTSTSEMEGSLDRYESIQSVLPHVLVDNPDSELSYDELNRYQSLASVAPSSDSSSDSPCVWGSQSLPKLDRYASLSSTGLDLSLGVLSLESSSDDPFNAELRRRFPRGFSSNDGRGPRQKLRTDGRGDRASTISSTDGRLPHSRPNINPRNSVDQLERPIRAVKPFVTEGKSSHEVMSLYCSPSPVAQREDVCSGEPIREIEDDDASTQDKKE